MPHNRMSNNRVLLINPPQDLQEVMGRAGKFVTRWEPLGLLYMAAVLLENGYDVCVLDAEAEPRTVDEVLKVIEQYDPAVIGITCLTPTAPPAVILGQRICEAHPQRTVVMGNVHAHMFSETLLRLRACHFIVHGEGEFVFLGLLRCLQAGGDPESVGGVSFLANNHYAATPAPPLPRDLDVIPPPARHLVRHIRYDAGMINNLTYVRPKGTVSRHAVSSRGCVFRCRFCVVHQERRFRGHSAQRVVEEMADLQENHNCGFLFFVDPIFVGNKRRVYAVCDAIRRRGLKIPWGCEGHVRLVDRSLLQAMRDAGCVNIAYGIESGSQRMLHRISKDIELEHVGRAVRLTRDVGIPVSGLFILGLPQETREEMEQTIQLAAKLPLDLAQFSMYVPYPGSLDFAELSRAGVIDTGLRADGSVDLDVWRRYSPYVGYGESGSSIYIPPGLTFDELFAMQRRALRTFYLRPRQIWRNLKRLRPHNLVDATCAAATLLFKSPANKTRTVAPALARAVSPRQPASCAIPQDHTLALSTTVTD